VTGSGLKDYVVTSWTGFVAPAKVPKPIIAKLNAEFTKAILAPDVVKRFRELGVEAAPTTPEGLWDLYLDDIKRWRAVITDAKLGQN
jgi:tripartite-type tricarboxylate transporter receptor subunit TctC